MARRAHSERPDRYRTRFGVSERAESPQRLLNAAAETSIGSSSSSNPQMAVDVVNFASTTGHNATWEPLMNNPNPPSSLSQLPVSVSSAANAHQQISMEEFASGSGGLECRPCAPAKFTTDFPFEIFGATFQYFAELSRSTNYCRSFQSH